MAKAKKLPSGQWRTLVYSHTEKVNGKDKRIYESFTADTKKESEYMAAEFALNKKNKAKPQNMTLGEAIDAYINMKSNILSPSTLSEYKRLRNKRFQGIINIKLTNLTQNLIQEEINKESIELSPKSIRNICGLLTAVLKVYYPGFSVSLSLPTKTRFVPHIPSIDDIQAIMQAIQGKDIELPVLLALWLGMRMSEIVGLRWQNVTEDYIIVKEAVVRTDEGNVLKGTKSYAGIRNIAIPTYIKQLLQKQNHNSEYVVNMSHPKIYRHFIRMLDYNNIPRCRFHDLRHANASIMLRLNIPDKYAMERLGHAQNSTLKMIYQHTMQDEQIKVNNSVDSFFLDMQHKMQHE